MNCPYCKYGVLEQFGFVRIYISGEEIELIFSQSEEDEGMMPLYICSVDECSFVITKAAPGTLRSAKRIIERVVLQHYPFPGATYFKE
ncbi:hypothetical protein [Bacillus mesophilum]|uniref:Uncharacterized protein n=1 Tax=Bacillus mesophilum TaxID=1071718 RepID=A0A7V7RHZ8_9BACI|nr:hypothetical protein [Bacillus mesophilum]KAB2329429.1 hypothetical protein F7732_21120 [Bacillus mesophilum]